jgi:hypothetical protein
MIGWGLVAKWALAHCFAELASGKIDRATIVRRFNPTRNASSASTPLQVGNGNFAFGVDVTGMQSILPFNTLSTWAWHNSSLPSTPGQTSPDDFTGMDWWTHGRLVNYDIPNPAEEEISEWLIRNPQRINLGRIGLQLNGQYVKESDLTGASQVLDLYTGSIRSSFTYNDTEITIQTVADPSTSTVAFLVESDLIATGTLSFFFNYPYSSGQNKFEAPFVGIWNATAKHTTSLQKLSSGARIQHKLDGTTYYTTTAWSGDSNFIRVSTSSHKYVLQPGGASTFSFVATFSPSPSNSTSSFSDIEQASSLWWASYWAQGAFVDMTSSADPRAIELQRRVILSQYLLAVNSAGNFTPQESGLTNNGWYGKFHLEMALWHSIHWPLWGRQSLLDRSVGQYQKFLATSVERARAQGYQGARWGKMTDPTGRSAPGEINALLIWQQPHPMYIAEVEYRANAAASDFATTLAKWDNVIFETAEFMASYAWWNESSAVYDLGPPLHVMPENTNPNITRNPTFELAYWRFGLDIATQWQKRQNKTVPAAWTKVLNQLAPLPVQGDGSTYYVTFEGIQDMWNNPMYTSDHPGLIGVYGILPPTPGMDLPTLNRTLGMVYGYWNFTESYGWDFPLIAMTAARMANGEGAAYYLLHDNFSFDDAGYPIGGPRVPTPYFPAAGGLLWVVAGMCGGFVGESNGTFVNRWPIGWTVECEGFGQTL